MKKGLSGSFFFVTLDLWFSFGLEVEAFSVSVSGEEEEEHN